MSDLATRIAQFEKMAAADPTNDMAHFSLGRAYLDSGRFAEAAQSLERCLAINPEMSKAYELAGKAMLGAGWADKAVVTLEAGYALATRKGDRMPQQAMAELLRAAGREPPAVAAAPSEERHTGGEFVCRRTGRPGHKLNRPPFRGPMGQWIFENISRETWNTWIGQGTKVINEMRLDLSRERDAEIYDQQMKEYLGIEMEAAGREGTADQDPAPKG